MVTRGIIGRLGGEALARMSEPGVEVLTSLTTERIFDKNLPLLKTWMTGATPEVGYISHSGNHGPPVATVPFGKIFSRPPEVIWCARIRHSNVNRWYQTLYGNYVAPMPYGSFSFMAYARITRSEVQFYCFRHDRFSVGLDVFFRPTFLFAVLDRD